MRALKKALYAGAILLIPALYYGWTLWHPREPPAADALGELWRGTREHERKQEALLLVELATKIKEVDPERAIEVLARARDLDPGLVQARLARARALFDFARYEEAIVELEPAIDCEPDEDTRAAAEAHYRVARSLYMLDRYEEAAGFLEKSLDLGHLGADPLFLRGQIHREVGEFDRALDLYQASFDQESRGWTLRSIALCLEGLGLPGEALDALDRARSIDPERSGQYLEDRVRILFANGRDSEARAELPEIEGASGLDARLRTDLALASWVLGRFDLCLELATLESPPVDSEIGARASFLAGISRMARGDYGEARRTFEALRLAGSYLGSLGLADLFVEEGDLSRALQILDEGRARFLESPPWVAWERHPPPPDDPARGKGRVDPRLIPASPRATFFARRGAILSSLGRPALGSFDLEEAISIDPIRPVAYLSLASVLIDEGRLEDATRLVRDYVRLRPGGSPVHVMEGLLAKAASNPTAALEQFEKALELDPGSNAIRLELAQLFLASGDLASARAHIEPATLRAPPRFGVHDLAARIETQIAEEAGTPAERLAAYERARSHRVRTTQLRPLDPRGWYDRARLEALVGAPDQALISLEEALKAGFADLVVLERDPALEDLRKRPTFHEIVRREFRGE